jgi:enoyl-CoA hydratase/carnithine racemase
VDYQDIEVSQDDHVGLIRLNRPDQENALEPEGSEREMFAALEQFRSDPVIRVVVLTGTGDVFSRGGVRQPIDPDPVPPTLSFGQRLAYGYSYGRFWDYLPEYKKPIIAAVNGYCADGGWDLVMLCDIVLAADSAKFHMNHIDMGIFPCHTTAHLLMQVVGKYRAMDIILNGRTLSAHDCLEAGLVNKVVSEAELQAQAMAAANELATRPPLTVSLTKQVLVNGLRLREIHAYELAIAHFLRTTQDTVDASRAWAAEEGLPKFHNR